jgi:hypothetical protein
VLLLNADAKFGSGELVPGVGQVSWQISAKPCGLFAAALIRLRLRLLQYFLSRDCSCNSILQLQQWFL